MEPRSFYTFYDVSRDWGPLLVPAFLTLGWLLGLVVASRIVKEPKDRKQRRFLFLWLIAWTGVGGFGMGNVWYQHFRCAHELRSGNFLVAEGPITSFRPEVNKKSEQFTVDDVKFEYYSANLGAGGLRWTGAAGGPLRIGKYVRVAYNRDRMILRLEVTRP